jgi:hypothetical protein
VDHLHKDLRFASGNDGLTMLLEHPTKRKDDKGDIIGA